MSVHLLVHSVHHAKEFELMDATEICFETCWCKGEEGVYGFLPVWRATGYNWGSNGQWVNQQWTHEDVHKDTHTNTEVCMYKNLPWDQTETACSAHTVETWVIKPSQTEFTVTEYKSTGLWWCTQRNKKRSVYARLLWNHRDPHLVYLSNCIISV